MEFKEIYKADFWVQAKGSIQIHVSQSSRLNQAFVDMNEQVDKHYNKTIKDFEEINQEEVDEDGLDDQDNADEFDF